ncbi:MAG: FG-GAP repeat protein [Deltaproteobacteria bacterium]|nr:FG-GAP repeat protein [Deltaproteobacteria bacterium]
MHNPSLVILVLLAACGTPTDPSATVEASRLGSEAWADAGAGASDNLGFALTAADLDGDGMAEIVAGAPLASNPSVEEGIVSLYAGSAVPTLTATLEIDVASSGFGASAAVADVNGDGMLDLLVGAAKYETTPQLKNEGAVFLFLGVAGGGVASIPAWSATGGQRDAMLGRSIVSLGDLDADGDDEFAVGVPLWDAVGAVNAGKLVKYAGGAVPAMLGEASLGLAGATEGWALTVASNFFGDGRAVIGSGAPNAGGRVAVYRADDLSSQATLSAAGTARLGYSLASGDLDGDGEDEIVIGDPLLDTVHVWSDASGDAMYTGVAGSHYGESVAVGDFEGDGWLDVLVGAPEADGGVGEASELRGEGDLFGLVEDWSQADLTAGDHLGTAVAAADVNGDGMDDGVLGASGYDGLAAEGGRVSVHFGEGDVLLPVDLATSGDYAILARARSAPRRSRTSRATWA